jgi:micrococcal nuclease
MLGLPRFAAGATTLPSPRLYEVMSQLKKALLAIVPALVFALPAPAVAEWTGPCLSGAVPTAAPAIASGATPATASPTCHFWRGKMVAADDGDTIDVRLPTSTGKRKTVRVRITGIQAMEQYVYTRNPRKRRGACHALPATARLEQLVRLSRGAVRLGAQDPQSGSGDRLRRSVAVRLDGAWHDLGGLLVAEGHALWLPNPVEFAWNASYAALSQQAAATALNMWDTHACGGGPSEGAVLRVDGFPNARGNDFQNVNGERVKIQNLSAVPVSLDGWWLRDSSLRRFRLPAWSEVLPFETITVRVGEGEDTDTTLYWGQDEPIFENPKPNGRGMGDGAYLFDPQGDLRAWDIWPCYVSCSP